MAAKVQSCRAAEHDVLAMLSMAMEATPTVSEDARQQAEAQDDTEAVEAMEVEVQGQCWSDIVNEGLLFVSDPPYAGRSPSAEF